MSSSSAGKELKSILKGCARTERALPQSPIITVTDIGTHNNGPESLPAWLHSEKLVRSQANQLLASNGQEGAFLVRRYHVATTTAGCFRTPFAPQHRYILSVFYKGICTHHLCEFDPVGARCVLNSGSIELDDCSSPSDLVKCLASVRHAVPGWPVPLKHPVLAA